MEEFLDGTDERSTCQSNQSAGQKELQVLALLSIVIGPSDIGGCWDD